MTRLRQTSGGRRIVLIAGLVSACLLIAEAQSGEGTSGGDTTVFDAGATAFGRALANLDPLRWNEFRADKERFVRKWPQRGPVADAAACVDCHFLDGRGPKPGQVPSGLSHLLRLGRPTGGGDPIYGIQLRRTGHGVPAQGQFAVGWEETSGRYASGERYSLRRPFVQVSELAYGPFDPETRMSLRVPLAVFGLGLLEAVPEPQILEWADRGEADGEVVSGKPQRVYDPVAGRLSLGRFGWKAGQPSLEAQSAAALFHDIGVTSPLQPSAFPSAVANGVETSPEVDRAEVVALAQYLRALAVPARRGTADPAVRLGERLFADIGCGDCHRQRLTTGHVPDWPALSHQAIQPYTDLLLHDMGEQLADGLVDARASGQEWRTTPLWGLGLLELISPDAGLLHDGRARSPEEAILWHGGEAAKARARFVVLRSGERDALLAFLRSL
jgi:CxxC motif-containing protein (DUF1111 family)